MVNVDDGSYGGMLTKLLFHLLPDQYPAGSIYAHFPFMTPDFIRPCIASRSTDLAYYDFSRPIQVVDNSRRLDARYRRRILTLTKGVEVESSGVRSAFLVQRLDVSRQLKLEMTRYGKSSWMRLSQSHPSQR